VTITSLVLAFSNADFAPGLPVVNPCGSSLANGASCNTNVYFRPSATTGTNETGTLTYTFAGTSGSPITVPLSGTVAPPIGTPATTIFSGTFNISGVFRGY